MPNNSYKSRVDALLTKLQELEENGMVPYGTYDEMSKVAFFNPANIASFYDDQATLSVSGFNAYKNSEEIGVGGLFSICAKQWHIINCIDSNADAGDIFVINVGSIKIDEKSSLACKTAFVCTSYKDTGLGYSGGEINPQALSLMSSLKEAGADNVILLSDHVSHVVTDLMKEINNRQGAYEERSIVDGAEAKTLLYNTTDSSGTVHKATILTTDSVVELHIQKGKEVEYYNLDESSAKMLIDECTGLSSDEIRGKIESEYNVDPDAFSNDGALQLEIPHYTDGDSSWLFCC